MGKALGTLASPVWPETRLFAGGWIDSRKCEEMFRPRSFRDGGSKVDIDRRFEGSDAMGAIWWLMQAKQQLLPHGEPDQTKK
jgi:hypothetical protein